MDLPKRYDPLTEEEQIQKQWDKENVYAFQPDAEGEIFSVDTPPPTLSGEMHIGHAFSYTQQDILVRYKRMRGFNVFYPFGIDDNGLATERLVEKLNKVKSKKMDRDEFIKLCQKTLKKQHPEFIEHWKRLGISCDFNVFYTTINDHSRKISQRSFIQLYEKGRIVRKKSPIIFCPNCKTAIAQVEMEDVEKKSSMNYIKAKVEDSFIIYATTRPELHPACVGISLDEKGTYVKVAVNDEHWIISKDAVEKLQDEFPMKIVDEFTGKSLVGKEVEIPYAIRKTVPITHDSSAKTEFGTGVVYYCSFGGLDCVEWLPRHPEVSPELVMDETGLYTKGKYEGMNSEDARKHVLADLEKDGFLLKKQSIKHAVNVHERCGTDIEYVATEQWFITYMDLKDQFLKNGAELNWYPEHMKVRLDNWITGLQWDWCISRQRHFGVPIPIWYDKDGKHVLPSEDELPIDPLKDVPKGYKKSDLIPEKDVLDTWATSSMTPQIASELFPEHKDKLFPMSLRPQAHDIITFWLFNTLVKSQLHSGVNPWKDVAISGFALDPKGKKMSKSKGNVIHPNEMISKYGADALRFWAAGSKLGEDLPFQEKDLVTGKKTITKLWNASKFVMMSLEDAGEFDPAEDELLVMDKWILTRFNQLCKTCTELFDNYEYAKVKHELERFFWQDFCDNYLEIVKGRLYEPNSPAEKASAQYALSTVLDGVLRMFAPFMPFVSERLYQLLGETKSVHTAAWPVYKPGVDDEQALGVGNDVVQILQQVRKWKSDNQISMGADIGVLKVLSEHDILLAERDLLSVTKATTLEYDSGPMNVEVK